MVKTTFSFEEHDEEVVWHVRQENIHAAMETEVHCLKKDMLFFIVLFKKGAKVQNFGLQKQILHRDFRLNVVRVFVG